MAQPKLQFDDQPPGGVMSDSELKAIVEALVYVADEPVTETTLTALLGKENQEAIRKALKQLVEEYAGAERGLEIKQIADGFKLATKAEHHEWVRKYVKHRNPPAKLSLAALETLAVIAYRQPMTVPEIQDIRGVNAVAVLKTLLDKKLITTAGRKNVIGRPILYKTTKEFLVHFGLKNLEELPSLEEFEDLARSAVGSVAEMHLVDTDFQPDINEREIAQSALELPASSAAISGNIVSAESLNEDVSLDPRLLAEPSELSQPLSSSDESGSPSEEQSRIQDSAPQTDQASPGIDKESQSDLNADKQG